MNSESVDPGLELRETVEQSLASAPVVLLQPISSDLLRVSERQPLRPVVDALALGPSCPAGWHTRSAASLAFALISA
jgi:hypothetical protein